MSATDSKRLRRAVALARLSEVKQRHGALVISGGRVLSVGINAYTSRNRRSSTHAEVAALRVIPEGSNLKNATLYVARVSKGGNVAMSKPCRSCQAQMKSRGVKKVVYTIDRSLEL